MQVTPASSEDTDLQQKRQDLFSLWSAPRAPAAEPHIEDPRPVQPVPVARAQSSAGMNEVDRLIHRFADPNADRMFLR